MPPAQAPRPDKATVKAFLTSVESALDSAAAANPIPGQPTMLHRLNRTEYINAVRDLLNVDLNPDVAALLPPDDLSYGFDNNGDVLGVSPLLLERYLSVARRVSIAALGPPAQGDADIAVYTHRMEYGGTKKRSSVSELRWAWTGKRSACSSSVLTRPFGNPSRPPM